MTCKHGSTAALCQECDLEIIGGHCMCAACTTIHDSCCSVHNMPAEANGRCDCSAASPSPASEAGELPELPESTIIGTSRHGSIFRGYTADQMHAHARAAQHMRWCAEVNADGLREENAELRAELAASTRTASDTRTAAGEAECDAARRAAPAGQHDVDEAARAWMVAHGYGNQSFGYALADLQSRIEAKDYEGAGLVRRIEVREAELMHERHKNKHLMQVLMSVYGLAPDGKDIKLPDGRVFRFNDPNASETLNALGRAIHAIPEQVAQIAATRSRAEGGNTQPESLESARPAEIDVEAERQSFEANHRATDKYGDLWPDSTYRRSFGEQYDQAWLENRWQGWLAARTQADAGRSGAGAQIAEGE